MPLPESVEKSLRVLEKLFSIEGPERQEVEVYLVELEDGRLVVRSKDELEKAEGESSGSSTGSSAGQG